MIRVRHAWLLAILLAAVVLRLAFSIGYMRGVENIGPEDQISDGYHLIAENLNAGLGYRELAEWPPSISRPPAYPLFLWSLFQFFGVQYLWVQIAQAILGALGCWLLYLLGRWVHNERLGLSAALLYAVYPNSIQYSGWLYAENLYFPVFLAFAYMLCRASHEGSRVRGAAAGALWGLSILTRGTLLVLPFVIPVGLALSRIHRRRHIMLRWIPAAVVAGILVATPWTIRNHRLTGEFVPVSAWGWAPFYHGIKCSQGMLKWGDLRQIDIEASRTRHDIVVERLYAGDRAKAWSSAREAVRHEEVARDLVIEEIKTDPGGFVLRAIVGIPFTWFQTLGARMRIFSLAVHLPLMILFVVGARQMAKRHPDSFARAWPALGIIAFVGLFQAAVFPHVRYMSPAISLSFIFSGFPIANLLWRRLP